MCDMELDNAQYVLNVNVVCNSAVTYLIMVQNM